MFEDMLRLMKTVLTRPNPRPLERTVVERADGFVIVSTVVTTDMGPETAVIDGAEENRTKPVERYATEEEAVAGHKKWCEFARTATVIKMLAYGSLEVTGGELAVVPFAAKPE